MHLENKYAPLYSKTIQGQVKIWTISGVLKDSIIIRHGTLKRNNRPLDKNNFTKTIIHTNKPEAEANRRYKLKYNSGYRTLSDLGYHFNEFAFVEDTIIDIVSDNMSDILLDKNDKFKSMKCQTFKHNKFNYPAVAQPKINGLRSTCSKFIETIGEGLFKDERVSFCFSSREGIRYVLNHLSDILRKHYYDFDDNINLDGELYIPEYPLNSINSAVPYTTQSGNISSSNSNTKKVQYWMFDLAIPIDSQIERLNKLLLLGKQFKNIIKVLPENPKEAMDVAKSHLKAGDIFIFIVNGTIINSDEEFIYYKDKCIEAGFEGAVLRDLEAEYAFGQRPRTMMKLKKFKNTECRIIDIIGEFNDSVLDPSTIKFVLKNDINDETFECTPIADHNTRLHLFLNKSEYIGKLATIRFYERSGVKKVPFHANVEAWDREDIGDINLNDLNKE